MFDIKEKYSHMPFVARGPLGEIIQLCCLKRNDKWKVHYFDNGIWRKLATYTNDDATECCPTAEWNAEEQKWIISFIAGGSVENDWRDVEFYLYKKYGFDDTHPVKVVPADVGFIEKGRVFFAPKTGPIFEKYDGGTNVIQLTNVMQFIYRLNYDPHNPSRLLISGKTMKDEIVSFVYDDSFGKTYILKDGDKPCYKCCFFGNDVYYCRRNDGEGFDDRQIVKASNPTFTEVKTSIFIKNVTTTEEDLFEGEI